MIRVGVFGLGTIGRQVCRAIDADVQGIALIGGCSRDQTKAEAFLGSLESKPPLLSTAALIEASDLVVEAATQAAVFDLVPKVLEAGKDLMIMSCGALLGRRDWISLAERRGCRIFVPSGGIVGLDGMKGARIGRVTRVSMESRKSPQKWAGAPYINERGIDLGAITSETLLFEGSATEACKGFPANVNILAALSLSGIGPEQTSIRIFAVPDLEQNAHQITVEGEFGRFRVEVENVPSENGRTAKLAYLSAIAMLKELGAPLRVGT
jgi:aspartate dehydrogenase